MERRKFLGLLAGVVAAPLVLAKVADLGMKVPFPGDMPCIRHPKGILVIKNYEDISPEELERFAKQWRKQLDAFGTRAWRAPLIAGLDVEWIPLS